MRDSILLAARGDRLPLIFLASIVALMVSCDRAPEDAKPGYGLAAPTAAAPTNWRFASSQPELFLEVATWWGHHSVTLWYAVVDGRLFIATTSHDPTRKRWSRELERDPKARVQIADQAYEVTAVAVTDAGLWRRVMTTLEAKYRSLGFERYEYPSIDDTSRGRIYELQSR